MGKVEITTIDREFYKILGQEISEARHKNGYSLRYMSELTGISRATLDYYELGKCKMKYTTYEKICKTLGIQPKIKIDISIGATIGTRW